MKIGQQKYVPQIGGIPSIGILKSWVSLYVNIFCVIDHLLLQQNCFELYNPYMYAYVYLRRLYPKEIENFEIFFGQPKSKASECFLERYRLQKGKCIFSAENKKDLHSQCQK